jgi:WD40 repeat protein
VIGPRFSQSGKYLAVGGEDRVVAVWDTTLWSSNASLATPQVLTPAIYLPNDFESGNVDFSPDNKVLAAAGGSFAPEQPSHAVRRLAFWEIGSWRKLDLLPDAAEALSEADAATTLRFSFDNRFLAVGYQNGVARVWDRQTGKKVQELRLPSAQGAGVHFAENSLWLGVQSENEPATLLVNLAEPSPRHVHEIKALPGAWMVLFDHNGKTAITHGDDGLIKFWSLETFKLTLTLRHGYGPGGVINLSPDSDTLCSADAHGTFKFWPAFPLSKMKTLQPN